MGVELKTITCRNSEATQAVARALALRLEPGDIVLLEGEVGAGKTHFARSVIQALLPSPEDIPSPTYTLVQTYDGTRGEIWHADLYRLTDVSELEELGMSAAFDEAICLVEWPDRLGSARPATALTISLTATAGDDARTLIFRWSKPCWKGKLEGVTDG